MSFDQLTRRHLNRNSLIGSFLRKKRFFLGSDAATTSTTSTSASSSTPKTFKRKFGGDEKQIFFGRQQRRFFFGETNKKINLRLKLIFMARLKCPTPIALKLQFIIKKFAQKSSQCERLDRVIRPSFYTANQNCQLV